MKKNIKPVLDCILCEDYEYLNTSDGGIILPNKESQTFHSYVKIVDIGDRVKIANIGDVIMIDKNNGFKLEHDNKKYKMIREGQIIAKLIDNE